jgi:formylglycine-generating enzyme required for sulfatase activity
VRFKTIYRAQTTPVDTFVSNRFGLHDMHGNVWEWVEDAWHANYDGAPADGAVWAGGDANLRVLRGGSWRMGAAALRSAHRHSRQPRHRSDHVGFRVARTVDAAEGTAVASAASCEK